MSRLRVPFGLAAASIAIAAGPAAAQYYGPAYPGPYSYNVPPPPGAYYGPRPYGGDPYVGAPRTLSPRAVVERLEDQGFEDVGRPRFTGTLYVVDATAPGDIRMRVVVDAVRGIVLNRTALGDPRRFDLGRDEDDEDRPPSRRYSGRPGETGPAIERFEDPAARRPPAQEPRPRREAARPAEPAPGALPAPADPRLSPGTPPPAAAPSERQAVRTPPPTRVRPETDAKPYGLNPSAPAPAQPKPAEVARTPDKPADMARRPVPARENGVANKPPQGESATADAGPRKPVRVIGGVTPMNEGAPAPPAPLDNLPPPPAAPAPTGTE